MATYIPQSANRAMRLAQIGRPRRRRALPLLDLRTPSGRRLPY
jgi:hypothetical protein